MGVANGVEGGSGESLLLLLLGCRADHRFEKNRGNIRFGRAGWGAGRETGEFERDAVCKTQLASRTERRSVCRNCNPQGSQSTAQDRQTIRAAIRRHSRSRQSSEPCVSCIAQGAVEGLDISDWATLTLASRQHAVMWVNWPLDAPTQRPSSEYSTERLISKPCLGPPFPQRIVGGVSIVRFTSAQGSRLGRTRVFIRRATNHIDRARRRDGSSWQITAAGGAEMRAVFRVAGGTRCPRTTCEGGLGSRRWRWRRGNVERKKGRKRRASVAGETLARSAPWPARPEGFLFCCQLQ